MLAHLIYHIHVRNKTLTIAIPCRQHYNSERSFSSLCIIIHKITRNVTRRASLTNLKRNIDKQRTLSATVYNVSIEPRLSRLRLQMLRQCCGRRQQSYTNNAMLASAAFCAVINAFTITDDGITV